MFFTVLVTKVFAALGVCTALLYALGAPLHTVLVQSLPADAVEPWGKLIRVALYVIAVAQGVPLESLKPYLFPKAAKYHRAENTQERWGAELFQTVVDSLKAVVLVLLFIFLAATLVGAVGRLVSPAPPA